MAMGLEEKDKRLVLTLSTRFSKSETMQRLRSFGRPITSSTAPILHRAGRANEFK